MPPASSMLAAALATLVLVAIPGPNLIYIVSTSLHGGTRAGVLSALGVETGTLAWVAASAGGVATALAACHALYTGIRLAGAAYLGYLAIRTLRPRGGEHHVIAPVTHPYRDGVLVNLLNPKTGLFLLAFLPQFTDRSTGHAGQQMLVLGTQFFFLALALDLLYALTAGAMAGRLTSRARTSTFRLKYAIAAIYGALALYAAVLPRP